MRWVEIRVRVLVCNSCCHVLGCVLITGVCFSLSSLHGHCLTLPVLLLSLMSVLMFFPSLPVSEQRAAEQRAAEQRARRCAVIQPGNCSIH